MAKLQCNFPTSLDNLNTDRIAGQDCLSATDDIMETAITQIEAELRRVTTKTATGTLTASEGGLIKVSSNIVTGTDIAFVDGGAGEDTITSVADAFGDYAVGDTITVSGSASNDGDYTILSVVAGTINVATALLTAEAAGASVTISNAYTNYLPTAVGNTGLEYTILKTDDNANLITVDADGTETINGALTYTDLNYQWACAGFKSDGANWVIKVTKLADAVTKTGTFTAGKITKINNASGIIEEGTNIDTDVADAVTKKHSQNTDTDLDATFEATFAKKADKLSVFAPTTSAELAGVISDETGTGALVLGTSPTISSPTITGELGGELDAGAHTIGFTQQAATGDGTTTIDWKLGNKFYFTFGAQADTFIFTAPTNPCNLVLVLKQDATGGRLATYPATVLWAGGTKLVLSTAASAVDIVSFYFDGTNYFAVGNIGFA